MAILSPPVVIPGSTTTAINVRYERTSKRTYRLYTSPGDSDIDTINNLPLGLKLYSSDPSYARFIVTDVSITDQADLRTHPTLNIQCREWHAEVSYGPWTYLLYSTTGNPVDMPPQVRVNSTRIALVAEKDTEGNPVCNVVGDPFNPPVEKDSVASVLVVTRNETSPNLAVILDTENGWSDHINPDPWNGFPARTVKISPISLPDRQYSQETDSLYYPMEYQFEFNFLTWDKVVLNHGFREFDPDSPDSSKPLLRNVLIEGAPADDPVLLDAQGRFLQPPVNKDDIVYLKFKVYKDLNFSVLGFDNLFNYIPINPGGGNAPGESPGFGPPGFNPSGGGGGGGGSSGPTQSTGGGSAPGYPAPGFNPPGGTV